MEDTNDITKLIVGWKADVFDILAAIDQHRLAIQQLEQAKAQKVAQIIEAQKKLTK